MRLIAAFLVVIMLCSCSAQLGMSELLSPPRLTDEQSAIYDAIELSVGTDAFKFRYPRRGKNLSACVITDLDNDGAQEAIVFYELTVNGVTSSWLNILTEREGVWKSRYQLPGEGAAVDFIDFAPIEDENRNNIIVGWSVAGQDNLLCRVYTYGSNSVALSYEGAYNEVLIEDMDGNGLSELLLCTRNLTRRAVMSLVKYRAGNIVKTSEVELPLSMTDYAQLSFGKLTTGLSAVFADVYLGSDEVSTRIAAVDAARSTISLIDAEEMGIYESFDRSVPTLYCDDVNLDGLMDIPVSVPLLGYERGDEREAVMMTRYMSVINGELETVQRSVVNFAAGYQMKLPDKWENAVTVARQSETNEWRFVLFDSSLQRSDEELLRIKVTSPSDYIDKLDTEEYVTVASKGVNAYQIYIPPTAPAAYSITYEQAIELFELLSEQAE